MRENEMIRRIIEIIAKILNFPYGIDGKEDEN